jgi:hypothetical protein
MIEAVRIIALIAVLPAILGTGAWVAVTIMEDDMTFWRVLLFAYVIGMTVALLGVCVSLATRAA